MLFESDEKLYAVIGKNIKKYRTIAGLTQVQLCENTGISLSYLSQLFSKCNVTYIDLGYAYYAKARNAIWNTCALDFTVESVFVK